MKPSQKRPSDYEVGDHVGIVNKEELEELCNLYLSSSTLSSKQLDEFANHHVQIHWLPNQYELRTSWDGCIQIITKKKKIFKVPFAAIIDLSDGIVEEPEDEEMEPERIIVRDSDSENNLVQQLAAETIQSTFRLVSSHFS
jgi:hypothetical protein